MALGSATKKTQHPPGFAPESGRVWAPGYNLRAIPQLPTRDGVLPIGPD